MEEDKRKFLLSRIKRQQTLIISQFQKFKKTYELRDLLHSQMEPYLAHISHTMQINNSLASNLFDYLDKQQVQAIFSRINSIFSDLMSKYKKSNAKVISLQSSDNVKQIREICEICHQKIQSNRIQNIRRGLDQQSQTRTALIKKIIEQSQLQRMAPLFTQQQDQQFKKQLEKVFQKKELMLQTNINQSNIFLTTVEEEIASFMISFRRDFAQWGGQSIEEQNQNWGKLMKSYINKKLTNSFNIKIPNWIKKMHELFVEHQPVKIKQYFTNKQCQTNLPSDKEISLMKQVQELNHLLIMKREALKDKEREIQLQKIRNTALQNQIQSTQKYYVDKLYNTSKTKKQKQGTVEEIRTSGKIRQTQDGRTEKSKRDQMTEEQEDNDIRSTRSKNKMAKLKYQVSTSNKSSNKQIKHNSYHHSSAAIQKFSSGAVSINESSKIISQMERKSQFSYQGDNLRLKKKVYTRQNREQGNSKIIQRQQLQERQQQKQLQGEEQFERQKQGQQSQFDGSHHVKRQKSLKKSKLKTIENEINQSSVQNKPSQLSTHNRRFNSISVTEDVSQSQLIPKDHSSNFKQQSSQKIKAGNNKQLSSLDQAISHKKQLSRLSGKPQLQQKTNINKHSLEKENLRQGVNKLIQLSKCEELVTDSDKNRLNKMVYHFFDKLQSKHSNSLYFSPVKIAQINLFSNKQNQSILYQSKQTSNIYKGLQKSRKYHKGLQRNKSMQSNSLKLPAISIHNSNSHQQGQDLLTLSKNNISLFVDEAHALKFQLSFNGQQKMSTKPTPSQLQQIQNMFSELQLERRQNNLSYTRICTFLRYPYTSSTSTVLPNYRNCNLNFATFCNYFLKILFLHKNCQKVPGQKFCQHIEKFKNKLKGFIGNKY